jgi:hypothetical protein
VVDYDSIIPPGREGKVTPEVRVEGMRGGSFKKSVSVMSNAKNKPDLKLSLAATIKPVIDVSPSYLRLKNEPVTLTLSTEKPDLKVTEVVFQEQGGGAQAWQASLPLQVNHTLARAEKPKKDGYYDYKLTLSLGTPPSNGGHGDFKVRTNHAEKSEIDVRGMISAGDQ